MRPSFWDSLADRASDWLHDTLDRAVDDALNPPRAKHSTPMRIKSPKTVNQLCNVLHSVGIGNSFYQEQGPIRIGNIRQAVLFVETPEGEQVQVPIAFDGSWRNPWQNEDGTGRRVR